ncbi:uncharacterized protein JCM10292_006371 [Rhodotorula paludigena]|uniref:uncharacterized protein n=1 Tax=Rhodotorula paludigena TaxID=86838 RepID=UPI00317F58CD
MPVTRLRRPSLPSSVLPKLGRSLGGPSSVDANHLLALIAHLRLLYASADEGAAQPSDSAVETTEFSSEVEEDETVDPLHQHDAFERTWAINWLNLVVRRGEDWVQEAQDAGDDKERELRLRIVDEAASLVSLMTATSESGSILRPLLLPTCLPDADPQTEPLLITLNDALPSSLDPTSVGLQSWGSSIILARMIALEPYRFGLGLPNHRALELGAGTGLLSLVWKGMSERLGTPSEVFATDYHEGVLENLKRNVEANSAAISPITSPAASPHLNAADVGLPSSNVSSLASSVSSLPVQAHKLDWSAVHSSRAFSAASNRGVPVPVNMPPPFDRPFHTLLAADVVYGPTHAQWLKSCVEQFLIKPDAAPSVADEAAALPRDIAELSLDDSAASSHAEADAKALPLPSRPSLHETASSAVVDSQPSHVAKTFDTTGPTASPQPAHRPAFHLIVPLRPTHAEAIATIELVFPKREALEPRASDDAPYRVAIETVTEIERVQGVGRSDEENYRLYRISWC